MRKERCKKSKEQNFSGSLRDDSFSVLSQALFHPKPNVIRTKLGLHMASCLNLHLEHMLKLSVFPLHYLSSACKTVQAYCLVVSCPER